MTHAGNKATSQLEVQRLAELTIYPLFLYEISILRKTLHLVIGSDFDKSEY